MKMWAFFLTALAAMGTIALDIPRIPGNVPADLIPEYIRLYDLCQNGGPNTYIGVHYGSDTYTTFDYGQCYPIILNGESVVMSVFCRSVLCDLYTNPECSGSADPPIPVPFPRYSALINVADVATLYDKGAVCRPLALL